MGMILDNPKEFLEKLSPEEFESLLKEFDFEYEDVGTSISYIAEIKKYIQNIKINNIFMKQKSNQIIEKRTLQLNEENNYMNIDLINSNFFSEGISKISNNINSYKDNIVSSFDEDDLLSGAA